MQRRVALALALSVAGIVAWMFHLVRAPSQGFQGAVFIDIPKGTSARTMALLLEQQGVIESQWRFLATRALRPRARLQAGEYRFDRPSSTWEVFDRIVRGDVFYYELVVPEGRNMFEIADSIEQLGLAAASAFLAQARDPALIRDIAPQAPTLEGYLYPDTYRFTRSNTPREICETMTARFRKAWEESGSGTDIHRTVTLASLVEKETAIPEERALVASVFTNRLRIGMKLDCDPTTIYSAILDGRYRGAIHQSDLERKNPYNTYQYSGLPPGPIANPGLASLQAALQPAESEFLYFVAHPGNSGRHVFSSDIGAHQLAVARYQSAHRKTEVKKATPKRSPERAASRANH